MDIPYLPPICPLERCPAGTETETKEVLPPPHHEVNTKSKKVQKNRTSYIVVDLDGPNAVGSKRKGELLYARQKKRAKHPAPDAAP